VVKLTEGVKFHEHFTKGAILNEISFRSISLISNSGLVIFWRKYIIVKAARKMLMK